MSDKVCIKCSGTKTGNDNSYCKSCKKEKSRSWREANKNYYRKYYLKNKQKIDEYQKKYNEMNPEKHLESSRLYAKNNPGYVKSWKIKNKEKLREYSRKREALRRGNEHKPYTEQDVLLVYGTSCNECNLPIDMLSPRQTGLAGWENGLQIDHFIPISKGGPDTLENVRPTHGLCNLRKLNN
jgi:5-methylcytosine-specific restriction endonuclease McrA